MGAVNTITVINLLMSSTENWITIISNIFFVRLLWVLLILMCFQLL